MAKLVDDSVPDLEIAPYNEYCVFSFHTPFGDTIDVRYTREGLYELSCLIKIAEMHLGVGPCQSS